MLTLTLDCPVQRQGLGRRGLEQRTDPARACGGGYSGAAHGRQVTLPGLNATKPTREENARCDGQQSPGSSPGATSRRGGPLGQLGLPGNVKGKAFPQPRRGKPLSGNAPASPGRSPCRPTRQRARGGHGPGAEACARGRSGVQGRAAGDSPEVPRGSGPRRPPPPPPGDTLPRARSGPTSLTLAGRPGSLRGQGGRERRGDAAAIANPARGPRPGVRGALRPGPAGRHSPTPGAGSRAGCPLTSARPDGGASTGRARPLLSAPPRPAHSCRGVAVAAGSASWGEKSLVERRPERRRNPREAPPKPGYAFPRTSSLVGRWGHPPCSQRPAQTSIPPPCVAVTLFILRRYCFLPTT